VDTGEVAECPPGTRSHLISVDPGVEVGGPQTLGGNSVAGATVAVVAVAAITVILLLAGLLWLLLLRALLVLLLSGWAFLPTNRGGRWMLLRGIEGGGGRGSGW
jgi:hypothetical protein